MNEYCPKCGRLLAQSSDDDRLCACGWWGDKSETEQDVEDVQSFVLESAGEMLDLFRDACRKEILAEAIAENNPAAAVDMPRIRQAIRGAKISILTLIGSLAERSVPRCLTSDNGMVPWPLDWTDRHYNSNEPCDMLVGPCACGAWHLTSEEWVQEALLKHGAIIE